MSQKIDETSLVVDGAFFARISTPVEFIIIRHGESEGNAAGVFQGRSDYRLSDRGREQAMERGRALFVATGNVSERDGTAIFSSPLARAKESAELIAEQAGFPSPRLLDELTELDTGSWTGKSWNVLRTDHPEEWKRFNGASWAGVPDAEPPGVLYSRAVQAWTVFRDAAIAEGLRRVVAVTHGGLIQWLVRSTFGCRSWFPLLPAHNCAVSRLSVEPATAESAYLAWETIDERN